MILYPTFEMNHSFQHGFIELQSTNLWIIFRKKRKKFAQLTSIFKNDEEEAICLSTESNPKKDIEENENKFWIGQLANIEGL